MEPVQMELQQLVPKIKEELAAGKAGIDHYRNAGKMLLEAKKQTGHGKWADWLKANFKGLSQSTAARYMLLAKSPHACEVTVRAVRSKPRPNGKTHRAAVPKNRPRQAVVSDSQRAAVPEAYGIIRTGYEKAVGLVPHNDNAIMRLGIARDFLRNLVLLATGVKDMQSEKHPPMGARSVQSRKVM